MEAVFTQLPCSQSTDRPGVEKKRLFWVKCAVFLVGDEGDEETELFMDNIINHSLLLIKQICAMVDLV